MRRFVGGVLALLLLLTAASLLKPTGASAASGFNVVTSPLPIKILTKPGETVTNELKLKNEGDTPETIKVGLMKFAAQGETGQPNLFDLTSKDTYASWVSFSPSEFVAEPHVWKAVTMTIKVPKEAALGYYMAVTFSRATQPGEKDATNFKGAAATLILLNVEVPNETRTLQLTQFSTEHKLYEYLPSTFNIKVHNKGNIYLAPTGNIFIQRGGKTITTLDFNAAGGSVLPDSNRVFHEKWTSGFPIFKDRIVDGKPVYDEKHNPKQDLKWDFAQADKFRFGKYTAKLLVVYDNGTQDVPLEASLSFWVIPWKLMLLVLLIVLAVGYGVFTMFRSAFTRAYVRARKLRGHGTKQ